MAIETCVSIGWIMPNRQFHVNLSIQCRTEDLGMKCTVWEKMPIGVRFFIECGLMVSELLATCIFIIHLIICCGLDENFPEIFWLLFIFYKYKAIISGL